MSYLRRYKFIFIVLLFAFAIVPQGSVIHTYEINAQQKEDYYIYDENGVLIEKRSYNPDGSWKNIWKYVDGKISEYLIYNDTGTELLEKREYNSDGSWKYITKYSKWKKIEFYIYNDTGTELLEKRTYNSNEKWSTVTLYTKGKISEYRIYNDDGTEIIEKREYNSDGSWKYITKYSKWKKTEFYIYNNTGTELLEKRTYNSDEKWSTVTLYTKGKISEYRIYNTEGTQVIEKRHYNSDGSWSNVWKFKNTKLVEYKIYSSKGVIQEARYYDSNEKWLKVTFYDSNGTKVYSNHYVNGVFSYREDHKNVWTNPTNGGYATTYPGHAGNGIDIGSSTVSNYDIKAAKSGTVESVVSGYIGSNDSAGYGNQIVINHGGGIKTRYAHLETVKVSRGDTVNSGQVIAKMGYTGYVRPQGSGGRHLHFEVWKNGTAQNPLNYVNYTLKSSSFAALEINVENDYGIEKYLTEAEMLLE